MTKIMFAWIGGTDHDAVTENTRRSPGPIARAVSDPASAQYGQHLTTAEIDAILESNSTGDVGDAISELNELANEADSSGNAALAQADYVFDKISEDTFEDWRPTT